MSPNLRHNTATLEVYTHDNLTGTIPTEIGRLTNLATLAFGKNNLSGSVPTEMGRLSFLRSIALSMNYLSGEFPPQLCEKFGSNHERTEFLCFDNAPGFQCHCCLCH